MKLLTKRAKELMKSMKPVEVKQEKPERKSHKNELPSDEYKDLVPPIEIPLDENGKIVISVKRGGEFGLPRCDIRFYATTDVYTGFTKKGINFDLDKLLDLTSELVMLEDQCDELNLFDEFKVEEEDSEEE